MLIAVKKIVIHICLPKKQKIKNGVCHLQHSGKEQWETCSNNGFTIFHHLHTKRWPMISSIDNNKDLHISYNKMLPKNVKFQG